MLGSENLRALRHAQAFLIYQCIGSMSMGSPERNGGLFLCKMDLKANPKIFVIKIGKILLIIILDRRGGADKKAMLNGLSYM